jgi:hypothetical protein
MRNGFAAALAGALFSVVAGATPAAAQQSPHFTILVDTDLQDLHPDVAGMRVNCFVCAGSCLNAAPIEGQHDVEVAINGAASFTERVTVPITLSSDEVAATATHFGCLVRFLNSAGGGASWSFAENAGIGKAKQGTVLVNQLLGELPQ